MNSQLLRSKFKSSLNHLGFSLLQATTWINSRLKGRKYSYEQLYRFSLTGLNKSSARKSIDKDMVRNLARIGFWWDTANDRPYTEQEIETLICGGTSEEPSEETSGRHTQLSLLQVENTQELTPRSRKPSIGAALLGDEQNQVRKPSKRLSSNTELEFYRLRNWLILSLERIGRPDQPRTAAQECGYRGPVLGESLNLLIEGDRGVNLSREDYLAASYILLRVTGWNGVQPIFAVPSASYAGDWPKMILDLRLNGQPASP